MRHVIANLPRSKTYVVATQQTFFTLNTLFCCLDLLALCTQCAVAKSMEAESKCGSEPQCVVKMVRKLPSYILMLRASYK